MHLTGSGARYDVINIGNRLLKTNTDYTACYILNVTICPKTARENRKESATVK